LDEDGGHCFLKCKYVKLRWRALNLEAERLVLTSLPSSKQVTEHILAMSEEKKLLIVDLLWAWWDARNKTNAGEQRSTTAEVIYRARSVTLQGQLEEAERKEAGTGEHDQRWIPPMPDVWKINIDAAFWEKELTGAWGFVVRDNHATTVLAGAGRISVVSDALCAEAHVCIAALQAAARLRACRTLFWRLTP
jgi:hypothetical protein